MGMMTREAITEPISPAGWESLPESLLNKIFENSCGPTTASVVRRTCSHWRRSHDGALQRLRLNNLPRGIDAGEALRRCFSGIRTLDLRGCHTSSFSQGSGLDHGGGGPAVLAALPSLFRLESVSFPEGIRVNSETLASLPDIPSLGSVRLTDARELSEASLAPLSRCRGLQRLDLSGADASDAWFGRTLERLPPSLRELRIGPVLLASNLLSSLGRSFPCLRSLHVSTSCDISSEALQGLPPCLQDLRLTNCGEMDAGACAAIGRLHFLVSLSLCSCTFAPGAEAPLAEAVCSPPLLRRLVLSNCEAVTDAAVAPAPGKLRAAAGLRELDVSGCWQITDAGLEGIARLPTLTKLDVSRCCKVTPDGIAALFAPEAACRLDCLRAGFLPAAIWRRPCPLPGAASLSCLRAPSCGALRALSSAPPGSNLLHTCTALTDLDLSGGRLPLDAALKEAAGSLLGLRKISLSDSGCMSDAGISSLARMAPFVESVNLSHCMGLTDAGVAELKELPGLRSLTLAGCEGLQGRAFSQWHGRLPVLSEIDVSHCRLLTDEGLLALVSAVPSLDALDADFCEELTNRGLADAVRRMPPSMTRLGIAHCGPGVVDDALAASLPISLRNLRLAGAAGLTDGGIRKISERCANLIALDVEYCPLVSEEALDGLARRQGLLRAVRSGGCQVSASFASMWDGMVGTFREQTIVDQRNEILSSRDDNDWDEDLRRISNAGVGRRRPSLAQPVSTST